MVDTLPKEPKPPNEPAALGRTLKAAALFAVPLSLYFILPAIFEVSEPIRHVLLTLTAVMAVHLLDRLWLLRDTLERLEQLTSPLAENVAQQSRALTAASSSLDAMSRSGIARLYPSREEASGDIAKDLLNAKNTTIRLLGVSLNDFVRAESGALRDAWRVIEDRVNGKLQLETPNSKLKIMILIIDPECLGAQLRSFGESRNQHSLTTHLKEEVNAAAREFSKLQEKLAKQDKTARITIECRLYRLPPILFLCHVDEVCYVQQYHFWTERKSRTDIPVTKYARQSNASALYPMHEEMLQHFELIWNSDTASSSVDDYLRHNAIGIDKGAAQSGMKTVFLDHRVSKGRILSLLGSAKHKVTIQGISLHSFFSSGELFQAIAKLVDVEHATVDIEILLLDPECEQAKLRAYRERLFSDSEMSFSDYCQNATTHRDSTLYQDTLRTINNVSQWLTTLTARHHDRSPGWKPRIAVHKYSSSPACFVLHVDEVVLVEQYHYGKDVPPDSTKSGAPVILGKDMPLIEYRDKPSTLYEAVPYRSPFAMIINHLTFVFEHSESVVPTHTPRDMHPESVRDLRA